MKIKIVSFLLIVILFITMFSASCFADFEFISSDGNTYTIGDLPFDTETYPYYIIIDESSSRYKIYFSRVPFVGNGSNGCVWTSDNNNCSSVLYFKDSNSYSNRYNTAYIYNESNCEVLTSSSYLGYYTSHDILDSNGNVVFHVASQPTVETQGTLAPIVENQETEKVMQEILGLLPIVIVVIVSLIAIRKAIAFLRTLLHRS